MKSKTITIDESPYSATGTVSRIYNGVRLELNIHINNDVMPNVENKIWKNTSLKTAILARAQLTQDLQSK